MNAFKSFKILTILRPVHSLAVAAILVVGLLPALAQYSEEDMTDKINALKTELEEVKRKRDKIIAKRWDDKKHYNEAREKFNQQYDELKEKLELKNHEVERHQEEIESLLRDTEDLSTQLETEKIQFLGFSHLQKNAVRELARTLDKRFPVSIPERQKAVNQVLKTTDVKKDSPEEIFDEVIAFHLDEINMTREIALEKKGFLLSDYSPGMGTMLRLGMVASAYKDDKTNRTGAMLRTANTQGRLFEWREDLNPTAKEALEKAFNALAAGSGKAKIAAFPMDALQSRAVGSGYTVGEKKGLVGTAKAYLAAGGIWMWPLAIIAVAALLLLLERILNWQIKNAGSKKLYSTVLKQVADGKKEAAVKTCQRKKRSAVLKAINAVLSSKAESREIVEKELQEVILQETPALEKRLTTISVLGAAAPLLGLLGTVAGMIELFESITLYGTSDPKLMASGISIALITTQTGLAIAVPIMILHNFIANRVDSLVNKMETYALKSLNILWPNG